MKRLAALAVVAGMLIAPAAADASQGPSMQDRYCGPSKVSHLAVWANEVTSCQFAHATANRYGRKPNVKLRSWLYGPRPATVHPSSRALDRVIPMRCRLIVPRDSPFARCTGGTNARVWVTS